jgi:hypothetical protein
MGITPLFVGATHIPLAVTALDDSGNAINLTGATITARIYQNGTAAPGAGTVVVVNATAGTFTYQFASGDLPAAGTYELQFKILFGDGTFVLLDTTQFQVLAAV